MTLTIEAPTDAQLDFVTKLCEEKGYPKPAVYSKQHASIELDLPRDEPDPDDDERSRREAPREDVPDAA
jgi:hypothetical protein